MESYRGIIPIGIRKMMNREVAPTPSAPPKQRIHFFRHHRIFLGTCGVRNLGLDTSFDCYFVGCGCRSVIRKSDHDNHDASKCSIKAKAAVVWFQMYPTTTFVIFVCPHPAWNASFRDSGMGIRHREQQHNGSQSFLERAHLLDPSVVAFLFDQCHGRRRRSSHGHEF